MGASSKKTSQKSKVKKRTPHLRKRDTTHKERQEPERKVKALRQELSEALEHQTATSEVLKVIAGSPTELQPVLDTVIESAVKLAGAKHGHIRQLDGEFLRVVAHYGETPEQIAFYQSNPVRAVPVWKKVSGTFSGQPT